MYLFLSFSLSICLSLFSSPTFFLDASSHLYKRVCPSVRPSVRRSVGPSVTPVQKPRFSAVFGHGEILHWNKWSTNMFWESFHPSVRPSVSPYICHMINTRWDTARTHRCPVGFVSFLLSFVSSIRSFFFNSHMEINQNESFFFCAQISFPSLQILRVPLETATSLDDIEKPLGWSVQRQKPGDKMVNNWTTEDFLHI